MKEDLFYDWLDECPIKSFLENGSNWDIKTDTIYYGFYINSIDK